MSDERKKIIYFFKPVGLEGPIKIGCGYNDAARMRHASRWSPVPLELICTIDGDHTDESFLHNCFFDCHSHGEWFFPIKRLTDLIAALRDGEGIDFIRRTLSPVGVLKKSHRRGGRHSAETRERMSISQRRRHQRQKAGDAA